MKNPLDASAPYMGRAEMTNQDAVIAAHRNMIFGTEEGARE